MKKVLWHSPTKRVTYHSIPGDSEHFLIKTEFMDGHALHQADASRQAGQDTPRTREGAIGRKAAKIPMSVLHRAYREGWANDPAEWAKWANDSDNKKLRVWDGKL